jgi:hypothetical protein
MLAGSINPKEERKCCPTMGPGSFASEAKLSFVLVYDLTADPETEPGVGGFFRV